ncbi:hypothetical protein Bealeia1_00314 [Candidatus Bealeia paramacronuclearis]|uniref:Uncharacterized protein n=2 Tax=Candidatus Bealeia paramacronuclearis TaxID=1921001 RepID=A0ABZ2C0V1_9PROT|nr:hypothetical protein [Candidatus Bealeia paramacronuclearis]
MTRSIEENVFDQAEHLLAEIKKNSVIGKKIKTLQGQLEKVDATIEKIRKDEIKFETVELRKDALEMYLDNSNLLKENIKTNEKALEDWLNENNKYNELHKIISKNLVGMKASNGEITQKGIDEALSMLGWEVDPFAVV